MDKSELRQLIREGFMQSEGGTHPDDLPDTGSDVKQRKNNKFGKLGRKTFIDEPEPKPLRLGKKTFIDEPEPKPLRLGKKTFIDEPEPQPLKLGKKDFKIVSEDDYDEYLDMDNQEMIGTPGYVGFDERPDNSNTDRQGRDIEIERDWNDNMDSIIRSGDNVIVKKDVEIGGNLIKAGQYNTSIGWSELGKEYLDDNDVSSESFIPSMQTIKLSKYIPEEGISKTIINYEDFYNFASKFYNSVIYFG